MRDAQDTLRVLMLMLVLSLGATAYGYAYLAPRAVPPADSAAHPDTRGKAYEGTLPSDFALTATFSGAKESAPSGFALLNSVPITVKGGVASASAQEEVDEPSGTNRRTGRRSYTFAGTFDPKTKKLTGTLKVTMKVRDGSGTGPALDTDYRYEGTLSAVFTTAASASGTAAGTAYLSERYLGPSTMAPQESKTSVGWEFTGTRR